MPEEFDEAAQRKIDLMMLDPHIVDVTNKANVAYKTYPGCALIYKWTCGGCGERCDAGSDGIYIEFEHTEKEDGSNCGYVTDALVANIGFALVLSFGVDAKEALKDLLDNAGG